MVVIEIPMMPPREVSPNGGWSWRERGKAKLEFRECAGWAAREQVSGTNDDALRHAETILLDAEIEWCCRRKKMDDDNAKACLKAAIDGIADVLWDGNDRRVQVGTVTQTRGKGVTRLVLREDGV